MNQTGTPDLDAVLSLGLFRALADPNRQAILAGLACCGGSQTVGEVACNLTVDLSVVSRHLSVLREAGVLSSEREGKRVRYTICCDEVVAQLRALADALEGCCCRTEAEPFERGLTGETSPEKDQRSESSTLPRPAGGASGDRPRAPERR